jgi:phosphoribosylformylglycinamidine synthase
VKALVHVTLKQDVLDPQGKAIAHACGALGFGDVEGVRQGKLFEVELSTSDEANARSVVEQVAEKLLANPVIEDYELIRIES